MRAWFPLQSPPPASSPSFLFLLSNLNIVGNHVYTIFLSISAVGIPPPLSPFLSFYPMTPSIAAFLRTFRSSSALAMEFSDIFIFCSLSRSSRTHTQRTAAISSSAHSFLDQDLRPAGLGGGGFGGRGEMGLSRDWQAGELRAAVDIGKEGWRTSVKCPLVSIFMELLNERISRFFSPFFFSKRSK